MLRFSCFCSALRLCNVYQPNHCLARPKYFHFVYFKRFIRFGFLLFFSSLERVRPASPIEVCLPRLIFKRSTETSVLAFTTHCPPIRGAVFLYLSFLNRQPMPYLFGIFGRNQPSIFLLSVRIDTACSGFSHQPDPPVCFCAFHHKLIYLDRKDAKSYNEHRSYWSDWLFCCASKALCER